MANETADIRPRRLRLPVPALPREGVWGNRKVRIALAILVLTVAMRMALGLGWRPDEIYSIELA